MNDDIGYLSVESVGEILQEKIVSEMRLLQYLFSVPSSTFDATLVIVLSNSKRHIMFMFGDGVLVLCFKGKTEIVVVEYASNAPRYLSYNLNRNRHSEYTTRFGEMPVHITEYTLNKIGEQENYYKYILDDTYFKRDIKSAETDQLLFVMICSDGILSYTDSHDGDIPIVKRAYDFTRYKNCNGEFVKRRMSRLNKDDKKKNITHYDDMFCGTISLA